MHTALGLRPSKFTLYPDQERSVEGIMAKLNQGAKQILFVGATGSGKTAISAEVKRRLYPKKMLFVVHRDILIKQTCKTLFDSGFRVIEVGTICGRNRNENRNAPIQVLSVQTAIRRDLSWFDWDVVILDEAHTTAWSTWAKKLRKDNPEKTFVYLTATPWRTARKESFLSFVPKDNYIFAPLPGELIEMGRLCRPRYYTADTVDLSGIKKVAGDYEKHELSLRCNDPRVINKGLAFWEQKAPKERTIAFCVDVAHATTVAELAQQSGRKVAMVHGGTPLEDRNAFYSKIKAHDLDLIVSVDCLSEGFDVPNIKCAWLLRPTMSWAKAYQQMGRALRTAEGKDGCIILDQADLLSGGKLPLIEDLELDHFFDYEEESGGEPVEPRRCLERDPKTWKPVFNGNGCGEIIGTRVKICPHCGYVLPERTDNKIIAAGQIVEVAKQEVKIDPEERDRQIAFITMMDKIYVSRWHPASARFQFKERFNRFPPTDYYWRWTRFRHLPEISVRQWLEAVQRRKQDETVRIWLPKLTPAEGFPCQTHQSP